MLLVFQSNKVERSAERAFTMIELILILALLVIVTSLAAPSLSNFFRGRALDSEARQLLSLSHAAQSRAVAEGFPMLLWIDPDAGTYGLQEEGTIQGGRIDEVDDKAQEFSLDDELRIEVPEASLVTVNGRSLPSIRFLPDGVADEESATKVRLTGRDGRTLWLIQETNRLNYEIRDTDL